MRRTLVIGLTLVVSAAVLAGVRFRYPRVRVQQVAVTAAATADETRASAPIPQDAVAIEKRRHDLLAWNRRTLQEAYDRVGKKDPRWDELARKTLDLAARMFSEEVDPQVTFNDVYPAARAAVDAGCDDPIVAYLYARTSVGANDPGPEEALRRARAAAQGLAASRYPAFRRATALRSSIGVALYGKDPTDADREQARRDLDAMLALLEESVASDEHNEFWEKSWNRIGPPKA